MRILLVHNFYLQKGGEDTVFRSERSLLEAKGNQVETLEFHNKDVNSNFRKILLLWRAIFNLNAYRRLIRKIDEFKPEVIHIHNLFYVASPSLLYAAHKRKVPVVMTLHNYRLICPSAYLYHDGKIYEDNIKKTFPINAIFDRVWNGNMLLTGLITMITSIHKVIDTWSKYINGYIVFTEFAKSKFINSSMNVPNNKFFIKPNFTEDNGFNVGERGDNYIFMGRLSEEKGLDVLLSAAEIGDFKLDILGDGPMRETVKNSAALNKNVNYLGFLSKKEILKRLKSCRALIFPSVWYEGMPMVILEALATGTPIIVSKLGNPEIMIENYRNGIHFEPNDPFMLVEKIEEMNNDPLLRENLVHGAREVYLEKYTPDQNYEELISIYEKVM